MSEKHQKQLKEAQQKAYATRKHTKAVRLSTDELLMKYLREELEKQDRERSEKKYEPSEQSEDLSSQFTATDVEPDVPDEPIEIPKTKKPHKKIKVLEESEPTDDNQTETEDTQQSTETVYIEPVQRTPQGVHPHKPKLIRQPRMRVKYAQPVYQQPPQPEPLPVVQQAPPKPMQRPNNRQLLEMLKSKEAEVSGSAPISIFRQ